MFSRRHTDSGVYVRFGVSQTPEISCFNGDAHGDLSCVSDEHNIQNRRPLINTRTATHHEEDASLIMRTVKHNTDDFESTL